MGHTAGAAKLAAGHFLGKHVGFDRVQLFARGQDDRPLHHIAELAHIARPVICLEGGHCFFADFRRADALLDRVTGEEMLCKGGNVIASLGERGDLDRNNVQAIEEVFAEPLFLHLRLEVARSGGHHTDIHPDLPCPAHANEALLGKDAQDAGLRRERHVGDLVEIERPAVSRFEQTGAHQLAFCFFAEELFLEAFRRDPRGIHDYERLVCTCRPAVQEARCHFLARTGGSADEHATTGACNALQRGAHRVDSRRVAGEFAALAHAFAQP